MQIAQLYLIEKANKLGVGPRCKGEFLVELETALKTLSLSHRGCLTASLSCTKPTTRAESSAEHRFRLSVPYVAQWVAFKSIEIVTLWWIHSTVPCVEQFSTREPSWVLTSNHFAGIWRNLMFGGSWTQEGIREFQPSQAHFGVLSHCPPRLHENKFFNWIIGRSNADWKIRMKIEPMMRQAMGKCIRFRIVWSTRV